jgi:diguanylate cyclase (GGDEF)-like protein
MQKVAILYDASQAVMSTFDLDEVLAQILNIVRDYFQMQNAAIMLVDPKTQELYVRSQFGRSGPERDQRQKMGEGLIGAAAKMKRPVYVPDVSKDSRYIMHFSSTRSELAIPLIVRDAVVGVLDLQSEHLDFFDKETIDLMTLFSTQASIAIENARLYMSEQRRASQLEAINVIARQTTAVINLDELLEKVCTLVLEHFPVDHVALMLAGDGELRLAAQQGKLSALVHTGAELPIGSGLCAQAMRNGRTVVVNDIRGVDGYIAGYKETRSEMCVPLVFFGEKLGVLALESARLDAFDQPDVQPLEAVADICAAAIQNARYFEQAQQLAYLDGLTGIFNRRFFEMRIVEELERARRYESTMSVIMVDIDKFKKLNDEFGHMLGDEVLRQVSKLFQQQLRKSDVVCRYGGEEFAMLLPQTSCSDALDAAEKLRRAVEAFPFPGVARPVSISAGVASFPEFGTTRDEIVASADAALYQAKQTGRNRIISADYVRKTNA